MGVAAPAAGRPDPAPPATGETPPPTVEATRPPSHVLTPTVSRWRSGKIRNQKSGIERAAPLTFDTENAVTVEGKRGNAGLAVGDKGWNIARTADGTTYPNVWSLNIHPGSFPGEIFAEAYRRRYRHWDVRHSTGDAPRCLERDPTGPPSPDGFRYLTVR